MDNEKVPRNAHPEVERRTAIGDPAAECSAERVAPRPGYNECGEPVTAIAVLQDAISVLESGARRSTDVAIRYERDAATARARAVKFQAEAGAMRISMHALMSLERGS